jgi:DNA repair exonuclease SbcCD ATPase subunit
LQETTESLEKDCLVKKKALEMIPSAADNINKLQAICDKGSERIKALQSEWDQVKLPLEDEIENRERRNAMKLHRISTMIEEIKKYKDLMVPMVHDLKDKQERAQMLAEERAKLPKNLNRALYTHRIMDITSSIGMLCSLSHGFSIYYIPSFILILSLIYLI